MKNIKSASLALFLVVIPLIRLTGAENTVGSTADQSGYDALVATGRADLKGGRLDQAMVSAKSAIAANEGRYEGYALAALIAKENGNFEEAKRYTEQALTLAPENKKQALHDLEESLSAPIRTENSQLSAEARVKYAALMLIVQDADNARSPQERQKYLIEFLKNSSDFANAHPEGTNIWLIRASAALEMDYSFLSWQAGQRLKALGLVGSDDPKVTKVLATLERKGWLTDHRPPLDQNAWAAKGEFAIGEAANIGDEDARRELEFLAIIKESNRRGEEAERHQEEDREREKIERNRIAEDNKKRAVLETRKAELQRWVGVWKPIERWNKVKSSVGEITITLSDDLQLSIQGSFRFKNNIGTTASGKITSSGGEFNEDQIGARNIKWINAYRVYNKEVAIPLNGEFEYSGRSNPNFKRNQVLLAHSDEKGLVILYWQSGNTDVGESANVYFDKE